GGVNRVEVDYKTIEGSGSPTDPVSPTTTWRDPTINQPENGLVGQMYIGETRSEEHTSELQSHLNLVCRLLLEKKTKHSEFRSSARSLLGLSCIPRPARPTRAPILSLHDALPIWRRQPRRGRLQDDRGLGLADRSGFADHDLARSDDQPARERARRADVHRRN